MALLLAAGTAAAAGNVCARHAAVGHAVIRAVNTSWPGLSAVRDAHSAGDLGAACDALSAFYSGGNSTWWLRVPPVRPGSARAGGGADDIVGGATYYNPRRHGGAVTRPAKGPAHPAGADPFAALLDAWRRTGNPVYASRFDALASDLASRWLCAGRARAGIGALCAGGARAGAPPPEPSPAWLPAFFGFQHAGEFSTSSRMLMLLGLAGRAAPGPLPSAAAPGSTALPEWASVADTLVALPELNHAPARLDHALAQLERRTDDLLSRDKCKFGRYMQMCKCKTQPSAEALEEGLVEMDRFARCGGRDTQECVAHRRLQEKWLDSASHAVAGTPVWRIWGMEDMEQSAHIGMIARPDSTMLLRELGRGVVSGAEGSDVLVAEARPQWAGHDSGPDLLQRGERACFYRIASVSDFGPPYEMVLERQRCGQLGKVLQDHPYPIAVFEA